MLEAGDNRRKQRLIFGRKQTQSLLAAYIYEVRGNQAQNRRAKMRHPVPRSIMLRVCVYPSDEAGYFVAHCLDLDLVGEDKTLEGALSELLEAIETQIEACEETGARLERFAPPFVWKYYRDAQKAGRKIADELMERVFRKANARLQCARRLQNLLENVVGTRGIPDECLMPA